jgi:hypothetical protein
VRSLLCAKEDETIYCIQMNAESRLHKFPSGSNRWVMFFTALAGEERGNVIAIVCMSVRMCHRMCNEY